VNPMHRRRQLAPADRHRQKQQWHMVLRHRSRRKRDSLPPCWLKREPSDRNSAHASRCAARIRLCHARRR
jgi:hypothetical protein